MADTNVAPGSQFNYRIEVDNVGTESDASKEEVVEAKLAPGLTAVSETSFGSEGGSVEREVWTCAAAGGGPLAGATDVSCSTFGHYAPGEDSFSGIITLTVAVSPESGGALTSSFNVEGGGAEAPVRTLDTVHATPVKAEFGLDGFDVLLGTDAAQNPLTQAGAHPYDQTTLLRFNTESTPYAGRADLWPVDAQRDVLVDPPAGFTGVPAGVSRCSMGELSQGEEAQPLPLCAPASQIGIVRLDSFNSLFENGPLEGTLAELTHEPLPLFNMVPVPGVPAQFGFQVAGSVILIDTALRPNAGYSLAVDSRRIPQALNIAGLNVTLWGVPGDPAHDPERWCPGTHHLTFGCASGAPPQAFLRNSTSCEGPEAASWSVSTDSWTNPGTLDAAGEAAAGDPAWFNETIHEHGLPGFPAPPEMWGAALETTGCEKVPFTPKATVQPTSPAPDAPTGLHTRIEVPQEGLTDPSEIAQSDVRKLTITLPEGVTVNPAAAGGLEACTPAQIGLHTNSPVTCPDPSKIGSAQIETPALTEPLKGSVYLAAQEDNPFHSLLAIYVVAEGDGILIKLPGKLDPEPSTGRLTATFDELPQQPFSSVDVQIDGGPRAPLATPLSCASSASLVRAEGWNGKLVNLATPFATTCPPGAGGFAPAFDAGTQENRAGAFSPFTLTLSRQDGEAGLRSLSLKMPPGLLGSLKSVPRCAEPQASRGECDSASQIGTATTAVGVGTSPFYAGGKVYLTGPYGGSPFGLSVVVPAKAGPFDLGSVIVRSRIDLDPVTSQIAIASDPFPSIIKGIPLHIRTINVTIDRSGFMLNPTNCAPLGVTGTATALDGQSAALTKRFQAAECATLKFKPNFSTSTSAKTSKANGASLTVHIAFPHSGPSLSTPQSAEANIAKVHVVLPKSLPARLTTLQKACTAAQFEADPAGCPAASIVGHATAHTPILASALQGPAYFVSHGAAKFPDLILVLQGEGITIDLTGETDIKHGVTSSTFANVPDAPVSSFELVLPQGQHSALAANGDLCSQRLEMPTELVAQNGVALSQNTHIEVEGCSNALGVISRSISKRTLKLSVYAPVAGRLTASGKGITRAAKTSKGSEAIKLTLHATKPGPFTTTLRLSFLPAKPQIQSRSTKRTRQAKSLKVRFAK